MMNNKQIRDSFNGIYAIVDDSVHAVFGVDRLLEMIVRESSISVIQLRCKISPMGTRLRLVQTALQFKKYRPFVLIYNDEPAFLRYPDLDGVHLGQNDEDIATVREQHPGKLVGISTHSLIEVRQAVKCGADYLGCGCIFPTESKSRTIPLSLAGLSEIVKSTVIPTVAIGGINLSNLDEIIQTECSMAAVISGLTEGSKFIGQKLQERFLCPLKSVSSS